MDGNCIDVCAKGYEPFSRCWLAVGRGPVQWRDAGTRLYVDISTVGYEQFNHVGVGAVRSRFVK